MFHNGTLGRCERRVILPALWLAYAAGAIIELFLRLRRNLRRQKSVTQVRLRLIMGSTTWNVAGPATPGDRAKLDAALTAAGQLLEATSQQSYGLRPKE